MTKHIKNKWYINLWSEGKYIDFWFFNHFFSGFLLAYFLVFIKTPVLLNYALLFVLMILWEFFEYKKRVRETKANRIIDLLVGSAGFLLTYYLVSLEMFDGFVVFAATFLLFLVLEIWGYWAYRVKKRQKNHG